MASEKQHHPDMETPGVEGGSPPKPDAMALDRLRIYLMNCATHGWDAVLNEKDLPLTLRALVRLAHLEQASGAEP